MLLVSPARHLALAVVILLLATVEDITISPLCMRVVAAIVLVFIILSPFMMVELLMEVASTCVVRCIPTIARVLEWWLALLSIMPRLARAYLLLTLLVILFVVGVPLTMTTSGAILGCLPILSISIVESFFELVLVFTWTTSWSISSTVWLGLLQVVSMVR